MDTFLWRVKKEEEEKKINNILYSYRGCKEMEEGIFRISASTILLLGRKYFAERREEEKK